MTVLLHPGYFPNIANFSVLAQHHVIWEVWDNFQKQTFRNRCHICTDRGLFTLTLPIQHVGGDHGKQLYKDVRLDTSFLWQRQHWRTLQTAYRTSPFFEYYEDDIAPLYEEDFSFLLDFNFKSIEILCKCLQLSLPMDKTGFYSKSCTSGLDARELIDPKIEPNWEQKEYVQVFGDKHGFIKNASALDLLFSEGSQALYYLKAQTLSFLNA